MTATTQKERWAFKAFAILMLLGMVAASVRAWQWSDEDRARNLVVVAPAKTSMKIIEGPELINETQGIHTWSVMPGPITLDVNFPDQSSHQTKVIIPKGLGGLMLEVKQGADGDLELGYF